MTTLSAKADSFSGHVCGNPLRYVPKAQSKPEYIPCGVLVPVGCVSARAGVQPVRERFLDLRGLAARAASLCRIPRIYRDYPDSSFFRFLSEDVQEGSPPRVVGGLGEPAPGDALDV